MLQNHGVMIQHYEKSWKRCNASFHDSVPQPGLPEGVLTVCKGMPLGSAADRFPRMVRGVPSVSQRGSLSPGPQAPVPGKKKN
jgi:hypothetical protein